MNIELEKKVRDQFVKLFGTPEVLVKSPGRINVIGEHTDYNLGFVLPAAVDQSIYFAVARSGDEDQCSLVSVDMNERYDFKISELKPAAAGSWANYLLGVVAEIVGSGRVVKGFNLVFAGDVPKGSGMSSSAALECGTCFALNELHDFNIPKVEMVKMSQMAEHKYAGVKCGIMDQFASMMGKEDQVLLLDCKTLEYNHFPMELEGYSLLLCNSNVSHSLASSEYNVRRQQCEEGVSVLNEEFGNIDSLRDASLDQLKECESKMDNIVFKRCKYVIEENQRLEDVTKFLNSGEIIKVGEILKNAQNAMRYEYEVTCKEIDFMADFANGHEDVVGARMMGGGFGGCTINIVKKGSEDSFVAELNELYKNEFGKEITPIPVKISDGVSLLSKNLQA